MCLLLLCLLDVTEVRRLGASSLPARPLPPPSVTVCLPLSEAFLSACDLTHTFVDFFYFSFVAFLSPTFPPPHSAFHHPGPPHKPLFFSVWLCVLFFLLSLLNHRAETEPGVSLMNEVMQAQQTVFMLSHRKVSSPPPLASLSHAHTK